MISEWAYLARYAGMSWTEYLEIPAGLRFEMSTAVASIVKRENGSGSGSGGGGS